ncbi:MAG: DUF362 domain-containing protein [bacterium]
MKSKVSIAKCKDYDFERVKNTIRVSLESIGGLEGIVKRGNRVLLKGNIGAPSPPEQASTTHPSIIKAMIQLVREVGGIPIFGDSPIIERITEETFEISGHAKIAHKEGIEITAFNKNGFKKVKIPKGKQIKEIYFSKDVLNADVVISIPKLKTHILTYYTGAIKNMFGALEKESRINIHKSFIKVIPFSEAIVDVFSVRKPDLAIMDGIWAMEGLGPSHGQIKKVGVIISSKDSVALDAVSSAIIGYDPMDIPTTKDAEMRRLGNGKLDQIEILGEQIDKVKVDFEKVPIIRDEIRERFKNFFLSKMSVDKTKCKGCNLCMDQCPAKAIKLKPYPVFDPEKCILCFCCFELCPEGAITFEIPRLVGKSSLITQEMASELLTNVKKYKEGK